MAELPDYLQPHSITVQNRVGATGTGPVYAFPVLAKCMLEVKTKLVTDERGEQRVSNVTLYTSRPASMFATGSLVSWATGSGSVISVIDHQDADLGAWQHREVALS